MIGSVAVHAVLAWLVFHGEREGAPDARARAPAITVIEPALVEIALLPETEGGAPSGAPSNGLAARATPTRARATRTDPRGEIRIDRGDDMGDGLGGGGGRGGTGTGTGIGFGDGGSIERPQLLAPPPAPRGDPPSKARPAQLIYPTRHRDVDDAELFIMRVIVDDDGFVAGAKLVRGFGGRRDEVASQMIWRFRYAPALDDSGQPVRSTLDQRFLVGP